MTKKIISVVGAIVLMGSIVTGWVWVDDRWAKSTAVAANTIDIRINSLKDDIRWYQDQMAYIMNRCGTRDPEALPEHAHREYKNYQQKKEELERQLQLLMQKRSG